MAKSQKSQKSKKSQKSQKSKKGKKTMSQATNSQMSVNSKASNMGQPKSVASKANPPVSMKAPPPPPPPPAQAPTSKMSMKAPVSAPPTAPSAPMSALPNLQDLQKMEGGKAMSEEELKKLQMQGALPANINVAMNPTMHKMKSSNGEYLVLMVDAPPCGCRKVNGKKERCRLHRREKRKKKKAKKEKKAAAAAAAAAAGANAAGAAAAAAKATEQMTDPNKDDDSDRKKIAPLRHAEDSDEEPDQAIAGAITPDKICIVGAGGVGLLIPIDVGDNQMAGGRKRDEGAPVHGVLIKGPQDCPQFIPDDKVEKDANGAPKLGKCQTGTLVMCNGEAVFYPDGGCKFDELAGTPVNIEGPGVDGKVQETVGTILHPAGVVDINETGMPEFRPVDAEHAAPQDKFASVGVVVQTKDGNMFVLTKGQTVGSGDNAPVIAPTKEGAVAAGTVLAEVVVNKQGVPEAVAIGKGDPAKVVGKIVQGDFNQPIFVAKQGGEYHKPGAISYDPAKEATMKQDDWKALAAQNQNQQKQAQPQIEGNNVNAAAAMTGKSPEEVKREMNEAAKISQETKEVVSCSFMGAGYGGGFIPNRSVFAYKQPGGGGGGGAGRGGGGTGLKPGQTFKVEPPGSNNKEQGSVFLGAGSGGRYEQRSAYLK